ncbi:MAG: hypothetical protein WC878_04070 [Candidatus Paceibacterota bacterium]
MDNIHRVVGMVDDIDGVAVVDISNPVAVVGTDDAVVLADISGIAVLGDNDILVPAVVE